ncbi:MAG: DsbC family protein [Endozoicomonadaceae bacterium]|nr:DsbC family protein [Endozoicomonadaceae bacterium]
MRFFWVVVTSIFLLLSTGGHAGETPSDEKHHAEDAASAAVAVKVGPELIRTRLEALNSAVLINSITETPLAGIYEVLLSSSDVLYVSEDGQYLFQGNMLKLEGDKIDNLTNNVRTKAIKTKLANIPKDEMIIFSPKGETKAVIYSFTDVDCGYCRKFHGEIDKLHQFGIELRYLAFPRGGKRAPSYTKMVSAWCSEDRKHAMTTLKNGESIPNKNCRNPIDKQYQLGNDIGVRGTPSIFLEDGTSIPGYRPAADIARMLGLSQNKKSS